MWQPCHELAGFHFVGPPWHWRLHNARSSLFAATRNMNMACECHVLQKRDILCAEKKQLSLRTSRRKSRKTVLRSVRKLRKATISFVMSVCPHGDNSTPTGRILMKFDLCAYFRKSGLETCASFRSRCKNPESALMDVVFFFYPGGWHFITACSSADLSFLLTCCTQLLL